ncbi:hypothetical protein [Allomuricauda sp. R78024]|uniref:hypothetical protein n=1 Tax=Allomuricauda sp. R78024 TaxID=3093867 RepID=UPI0037C876B2
MKIKSKILGLLFLATFFAVSISCTKDDIAEEELSIENLKIETENSAETSGSSTRPESMRSSASGAN